MKTFRLGKPLFFLALMVLAAGLTIAATPTRHLADEGSKIDLEAMIPTRFADWEVDTSVVPLQISPDVQASLDKIYNQTLSRTYINHDNMRVMLSIAYGGDQSDAMQVHRPEVCYAAQGFEVVRSMFAQLATGFGTVPVKRLVAVNGARHEPITYWIVVGDKVVYNTISQKLAQIRYGLTGRIPDGLLFRVSTIDRDDARSFSVQDDFVRALLQALEGGNRTRLIGQLGTS